MLRQLQTQGSPSPWGGHLSPAFSMGDVHHDSSCGSSGFLQGSGWEGRQAGARGGCLGPMRWWPPGGWTFLTTASFCRCTPCTAGQERASSRPRRSFPRASSVTGPSAAPPHLLPKERSRGISPPDAPPSALAFSLTCLLSCTFHGCLKHWLCPAQTWGGSCLWLFFLPQQPALPST